MTKYATRHTLVRTATGATIGAITHTRYGTWQPLILTADGRDFQPIDTQDAQDIQGLFEAADAVNAEYAELVRMGDR